MNVVSRVAVVVCVTFVGLGQVLADEWHEVTIYACDQKNKGLRITHLGAYNEHGLTLLRKHSGVENLSRPVVENDTAGGLAGRSAAPTWRSSIRDRDDTGYRYRGDGECGAWSNNPIAHLDRWKGFAQAADVALVQFGRYHQ